MTTAVTIRIDTDERTLNDPPEAIITLDGTATFEDLFRQALKVLNPDESHLGLIFLRPEKKRRSAKADRREGAPLACLWGEDLEVGYQRAGDVTLDSAHLATRDTIWGVYDLGSENWIRMRVEKAGTRPANLTERAALCRKIAASHRGMAAEAIAVAERLEAEAGLMDQGIEP